MDDSEIGCPTHEDSETSDSLPRPGNIFPPGSPCSSLRAPDMSQPKEDVSGEDSKESPTEIFDSPISPENQKLSQLVMELAEKEEDYIGSEVESEFAVWEKNHKIISDGGSEYEFPSPHDRPPLFVRKDGTPTPGSLAPFWNTSIVLNRVDKDGPGNQLTKKPSSKAKQNPITLGVYKDQLYAFNNGAAKESQNVAQFWYNKTSVMRLIPGIEPSVTTVVNPDHECTDIGAEIVVIPKTEDEPQHKPEKMADPLEYYLCSKYPAYLVLDYKQERPKLISMRKCDLTAKLEDITKRNSTLSEEKFTPLVNIRKTDAGTPDCVLYFKTGEQVHFVQVDQSTRKLTIITKSQKEEVKWRQYRDFKEKAFKVPPTDCVDAPNGIDDVEKSKLLDQESKPAAPLTSTINGLDSSPKVEPGLKDLETKQETKSVAESLHDTSNDNGTPNDHSVPEEKSPNTPVLSKELNHDHKDIDAIMSPESPIATGTAEQTKSSNGTDNGVHASLH